MKKLVLTIMLFMGALFAANDKAPNFELTTITGDKVSLEQYMQTKKPLLVYFTASWCPVCAKNWPSINEVYKEYKDKVNFVAISIDPTDTNKVLTNLAKKHGLVFPMVSGQPKLMVDFGVRAQATTIIVNSKGEITFRERGHFSLDEYKQLLEKSLADE